MAMFGENQISSEHRVDAVTLFIAQFKSPIILILIGAAIVSLFLQDRTDATLILLIVLTSAVLGFWQEYGATNAVAKLRALVETKVRVLRDGNEVIIPLAEVVPGDVVLLSAGAIIPGDGRLLEARELFVNEAALTGETFPAEKSADPSKTDGAKAEVYLGTHVVSGSGKAEIVATGKTTRFGKIAESLRLRRPETEFERGVWRFGYLLAEVTLLLVLAIFGFNVFLHKPVLDSFLFALALAVGLTPQLLPAIITINLSHGARRMAQEKVIVKRLAAIENFGSMNVLCSDKTGTSARIKTCVFWLRRVRCQKSWVFVPKLNGVTENLEGSIPRASRLKSSGVNLVLKAAESLLWHIAPALPIARELSATPKRRWLFLDSLPCPTRQKPGSIQRCANYAILAFD